MIPAFHLIPDVQQLILASLSLLYNFYAFELNVWFDSNFIYLHIKKFAKRFFPVIKNYQ